MCPYLCVDLFRVPLRVVCVLQSGSRPLAWGAETDPSSPEILHGHTALDSHIWSYKKKKKTGVGHGKEGHKYH